MTGFNYNQSSVETIDTLTNGSWLQKKLAKKILKDKFIQYSKAKDKYEKEIEDCKAKLNQPFIAMEVEYRLTITDRQEKLDQIERALELMKQYL